MAQLSDILYKVHLLEVFGSTQKEVDGLALDSRHVKPGWLFAAMEGTQTDGHQFIAQAIEAGAVAILCERIPDEREGNVTYIRVKDTAYALGIVAANFYGNPSEQLNLVAVTGTNGKTTVSTLLYRLYLKLGYTAGLISTVENRIHDKVRPSRLTTPNVIEVNQLLGEMVEAGCEYAFMEASSIAIDQQRLAGLQFAGVIFTNITHDHLDYHGTFDQYIRAKKQLFDGLPASSFALVNADDKRSAVMLQNTNARPYTYGLRTTADFKGKVLENNFTGLLMQVDDAELHSRLIGHFNAYNLLAIFAASQIMNIGKMEALEAISALTAAEGRFEVLRSADGAIGIIDYAHTPDALKNVLETINSIRTGNETVISIVGCGGNRDKEKRPVMAEVAARLSDKVILTSDNPRNEDPEAIIEDMRAGVLPPLNQKLLAIASRKEAIRTAAMMAQAGDIILVAGKGHEKYQEVRGERLPFDDKEELLEAFKSLKT
jgi:UDP-N-acetylmuramoyl-L-alanyl-D-glutamate--2,6-diaminopimelate ligase